VFNNSWCRNASEKSNEHLKVTAGYQKLFVKERYQYPLKKWG
jgi:hypothetical protein